MQPVDKPAIVYPDSDGEPMADNTRQYEYIVTIKGGLDALFADRPDVFVAGDLLWYPVEGNNVLRQAPDVMVVFGRPKGHRGSYRQWEEDNIAPQVVFEILSPGNRAGKTARKFHFYERFGVQEYYIYDPDDGSLSGWIRENGELRENPEMQGWKSSLLGIRFELVGNELQLFRPDGQRFLSFVELDKAREAAQRSADEANQRAERFAQQLRAHGIEPQE